MNHQKKLIMMAGGTGGHVFPGLAIAHYLINQGWQVQWIGTADRIESNLVPKNGIKIDFICIPNFRSRNAKAIILAPLYIFNAWRKARKIMKFFRPNVVLGMGGYVSAPSGLAAWSLGIPIILHEQNSVAGLTNKLLSKIAKKTMQAFPGALPYAKVVGNPIRADILALKNPEARLKDRKGPIRVLVIGGSQGAQFFNQIMPKVASKLANIITILHQSGKGVKNSVEQAYFNASSCLHKVTEFINDMAKAYDWADVVVCRSGALTVSEIAAVGLPALFVPFQHRDRQQYWNAFPLEKAGAAKIFEQSQFTIDLITTTLKKWDRETLLQMAKCARTFSTKNSTERIAREIKLIAET